jgi:hypothetical protein
MPNDCPHCCQALEELVLELRTMALKDPLVSKVAARMEGDLQGAIAAAKSEPQDLQLMIAKLDSAKTCLAGIASARGLERNFAKTITFVKSHLP